MKKRYLAVAAMLLTITGTTFAFDPPRKGRNGGQAQGQQTGPRDGTGPIHTPGTGGGNGSSKGNGKMTGPRDGSGPIHTPGTGGGTGTGTRRGRR